MDPVESKEIERLEGEITRLGASLDRWRSECTQLRSKLQKSKRLVAEHLQLNARSERKEDEFHAFQLAVRNHDHKTWKVGRAAMAKLKKEQGEKK